MTTFSQCPKCCCNERGVRIIQCNGCHQIFCERCQCNGGWHLAHHCSKYCELIKYDLRPFGTSSDFEVLGRISP